MNRRRAESRLGSSRSCRPISCTRRSGSCAVLGKHATPPPPPHTPTPPPLPRRYGSCLYSERERLSLVHVAADVPADEAVQRADEERMRVERLGAVVARGTGLVRRVREEQIDLVERLDVIRDKRERHDEQILHPFPPQLLDHVLGARAEPLHRAGARLVREQL